jgi:glyoxylase-like metal-dependent hydrolase (beta-lactamase superfamily II)
MPSGPDPTSQTIEKGRQETMSQSNFTLVREDRGDALYLIDLPHLMAGFNPFLAAWLLVTPRATYLVDPGPPVTVPHLLDALEGLGIEHLDYILLTHIHLDHAGATARVLDRYPRARVFAHPRGRHHLVAPAALWQASQDVMGRLAAYYGPPPPVPPERLADEAPGVEVIETPGHAAHHLCFLRGKILFVGEAAGVYQPVEGFYLRPATPRRFFPGPALASLDRLLELDLDGILLCHGHYGPNPRARETLDRHRAQLRLWAEVAADCLTRAEDEKAWYDTARSILLERDPLLACFPLLPPDVRRREQYFLDNSLEGFRDYLLHPSEAGSGSAPDARPGDPDAPP